MLAGIGLKIALKLLDFTYELPAELIAADTFINEARIQTILISLAGLGIFVYLFTKFRYIQPAVPYFVIIAGGVILAQFIHVPMLHVEDFPLSLALPIPHFDSGNTWLYVFGFATMLAVIDVLEQVMSNAAIQKSIRSSGSATAITVCWQFGSPTSDRASSAV